MLDKRSAFNKLAGLAFKLILKRNFQRTVGFVVFLMQWCVETKARKRSICLFIFNEYVSKRDVFAQFCYEMGLEYFRNSIGERVQILIDNSFLLSTLIYVGT